MLMRALLAALLLATHGLVEAQQPQGNRGAPRWAGETNTFRGVQLGTSVTSAYPECPKATDPTLRREEYVPSYKLPAEWKDRPCFKRTTTPVLIKGTGKLEIDNLVFIKGAGVAVEVDTIDGSIEAISNRFLNVNFPEIYGAFKEKYGPPTDTATQVYGNAYGVKINALTATWTGVQVTLTIHQQIPGDRDWGLMEMTSQKFQAARTEWARRQKSTVRDAL